MNTLSRWTLAQGLAVTLGFAGCSDRDTEAPPPAPAAPVPTPAPSPATDQWIGQWNGPEGSFVRITGGSGHYEVTVQNLDGPRTFAGTATGDAIAFERDGRRETLRASTGERTGMKWLAGKKDCLMVRAGEGYCRD